MDQKTLSALEKIIRNALKEMLKTDAPVTIEDIFIGIGNRKKTASKDWQKGCMYHLAGKGLIERNADTYVIKEKQAIRQIISHYPLTQEVAICGTAIADSNFENIYALSIFQRLTDEQHTQFIDATKVVRKLAKGKPIRRDDLFQETASWQSAFMKRLVATGFCSVKGWTRWVEYKARVGKAVIQPDNEKIVELLFPKWYRYTQRVTAPGFLKRNVKQLKHSVALESKQEPKLKESDQTNVGLVILEKLVQYLQILEYHSTRLEAIETELRKISQKHDTHVHTVYPQPNLKQIELRKNIADFVQNLSAVSIKDICNYLELQINPKGQEAKEIANILREFGFKRTKAVIFDSELNRKVQTRIFKK